MDVFTVEKLLRKRIHVGKIQYLVKWKGYASKYNTWEPENNILDKSVILEFNKRQHQQEIKAKGAEKEETKSGEEGEEKDKEEEEEEEKKEVKERSEEDGEESKTPTERSTVQVKRSEDIKDHGRDEEEEDQREDEKEEGKLTHSEDAVFEDIEEGCSEISSEDEWKPERKRKADSGDSDSSSEEERGSVSSRQSRPRQKQTDALQRKRRYWDCSQHRSEHGNAAFKEPDAANNDWKEDGTSSKSGEDAASIDQVFPAAACGADHLNTSNRRKKACRQRAQKEICKRNRKKVNCCIVGCSGYVVNLHRHFQQVHTEIPRFEALKLIQKRRKQPKHSYPVVSCSIKGCTWKGTRPDKHLVSKVHNFEKRYAKQVAKAIRRSHSYHVTVRGKDMHTATSLSEQFLEWFQSIEGGNFIAQYHTESKKAQMRKQNRKYKCMVETVLKTFFGSGEFHKSALETLDSIGRNQEHGKKSVVEKLQEGRSWGTVKNYLCVFSHFIDFLESRKPPLMAKDDIESVRLSLKGCIQTVTKLALNEQQHRKLRDRHKVISFRDITQYLQMNVAQSLSNSFQVDLSDSDDRIRDKVHRIGKHVMLEIGLQNGKRAGIFNDMTCREVEEAVTQDGGYVIMVSEGKNFRIAGAAGVYCSNLEYTRLKHHIANQRPLLKPAIEQVFCRRSGDRATVSETGEFLRDAWIDFGTMISKDVGDLTFTLIRKTIVSKSRMEGVSKDVQEDMARHMDHSKDTANKYYDVSTGTSLTAKFRKTFSAFHDPLESDETSSDENEDPSGDVPPSDRLNDADTSDRKYREVSVKTISSEPKVLNWLETTKATAKGNLSHTFGKPDVFTNEDKLRLFRCCADLVARYRNRGGERGVTRAEILSSIKSAGPNFADLLKNYTVPQLCNRVRCELRKKLK